MARLKTVFSSNSQLAHVWAQQTQTSGRANNTFFRGRSIYSYGLHFETGRIVEYRGRRIALLNSDDYSVSTSNHKREAWSAVDGLMPIVHVPGLTRTAKTHDAMHAALEALDNAIEACEARHLKVVKVTRASDVNWALERIEERYEEYNALAKLMGRAQFKCPDATVKAVRARYAARLKRYHELNTPEMIAKRERERVRRAGAKLRAIEAAQADVIKAWRAGNSYATPRGLTHEILRVQGDEVVTNRGARVPLADAQKMLKAIRQAKDIQNLLGANIGHFTLNDIRIIGTDAELAIGCHRIMLSEARAVVGPTMAGGLKLVSGGAA